MRHDNLKADIHEEAQHVSKMPGVDMFGWFAFDELSRRVSRRIRAPRDSIPHRGVMRRFEKYPSVPMPTQRPMPPAAGVPLVNLKCLVAIQSVALCVGPAHATQCPLWVKKNSALWRGGWSVTLLA